MQQRLASDLFNIVCFEIYSAGFQPTDPYQTTLSPSVGQDPSHQQSPTGLPSSFPLDNWSEHTSRQTLANLCLVNRAWYEAAKPFLWRNLPIRLPKAWLSVVDEVAAVTDGEEVTTVERSITAATGAVQRQKPAQGESTALLVRSLHDNVVKHLTGPNGSIPPELLSPPASRDPSPRGLRDRRHSKSPQRWQMMRSITHAITLAMENTDPGVYIPIPFDSRPGRFVHHMDFGHFRTVGMRRSNEEGVECRFVTAERLEAVLREMPNLLTFGATEYMDGALTLNVLKELFLRGSPSRGRGRRGTTENEEEDRERRRECKEIEAVDLTGCTSAVFVQAFSDLVENGHLNEAPGLQRLGMFGANRIPAHLITPFVMAFPSLSHLDLSATRVGPELLSALSKSKTVRLRSLALSKCTNLTGISISKFLINAPAAHEIVELNLFGDSKYPSPLSTSHLESMFSQAPCFTKGNMIYLDLSSSPVSSSLLQNAFKPQLKLRSLGLGYIENLELTGIADFIKTKAPNVEILSLIGTSPDLSTRQASMALHSSIIRELCTVPFSIRPQPNAEPPTRLRVIELSGAVLNSLGAGAGAWRIVRGKGGRGWYVLSSCGWTNGVLERDLAPGHPIRRDIQKLSDANGYVSSSVGWHSRKMEILHGYGMLGREGGLYGAVSFAV